MSDIYPHQEIMQEEGLSKENLPIEICEELDEFDVLLSEYEENPSESGKKTLLIESVQIADSIQDYLEKDLPDNEDVEKKVENGHEFIPTWKFW